MFVLLLLLLLLVNAYFALSVFPFLSLLIDVFPVSSSSFSVCRSALRTFWVFVCVCSLSVYLSKLPTRSKFKSVILPTKNCKQNNNETQETLHGCLFVCVCLWWVEYERVDGNEEYMKLRGNEKEMLLFVDQNTKHSGFFLFGPGLEKGMCEGGTKTAINTRECRVRGSAEEKSTGMESWCGGVRVYVCVNEIKVSLLSLRVGKHNDKNKTVHLICGFENKVGYDCGLFCYFFFWLASLLIALSRLSIAALLLFVCCYGCVVSLSLSPYRWLSAHILLCSALWVKEQAINGALTRGLHFVLLFFIFLLLNQGGHNLRSCSVIWR